MRGRFVRELAAAAVVVLAAGPAASSLDEGLEAYAAGDVERAVSELKPVADTGDPVAQYHLWLSLRDRNLIEGLGWLLKAAAQGHPQAEADLGDVYRLGRGQRKDYAKAFELYKRAADKGEAGGLKGLGDLYRDGLGVPRDVERAKELYQHAVDLGSTAARVALGDLHRDGLLGAPEPERALEWYRQAAELGDDEARQRIKAMEAEAARDEAATEAGRQEPAAPTETATPGAVAGASVFANTESAQHVADRLIALFESYSPTFAFSELRVTEAGEHFEVEFTGLRQGDDESGYLDIPRLAFVMTPEGNGLYRVSALEAPSDMAIRDRFGGEISRLFATVTRFGALLALEDGIFVDSDIEIRDVRMGLPAKGIVVVVDKVTFKDLGRRDGEGLWNVEGDYRLSGLRLLGSGAARLDIAELRLEYRVASLSAADLNELFREIEGVANASGAQERRLSRRLASRLADGPRYFGDLEVGVSMRGLNLQVPQEAASVALSAVGFSIEATKVREPRFDLAFRTSVDGLAIRGGRDAQTVRLLKVLPRSARLNVIVEKLPKAAFTRAFLGYLANTAGSRQAAPEMASLYAWVAMQQLWDDLSEGTGAASMGLRIVDTAYVAPILTVSVAGDFTIDKAAAFGVVGNLTIGVVGLDEALALVQMNPATEVSPRAIDALRATSRRVRATDGTVVDTFIVRLSPGGAITVNGRPYESLINAR